MPGQSISDKTIDRAADNLAEYHSNDTFYEVLDQYAVLIKSYKHLKSDYEEERETRERYKQLARGQERNPVALVVINRDSYIFDESFVRGGDKGGSKAAKQLNDTVKASLCRKGLEGYDIIVRTR